MAPPNPSSITATAMALAEAMKPTIGPTQHATQAAPIQPAVLALSPPRIRPVGGFIAGGARELVPNARSVVSSPRLLRRDAGSTEIKHCDHARQDGQAGPVFVELVEQLSSIQNREPQCEQRDHNQNRRVVRSERESGQLA
jgi:hypothetical protein